MNVTTFNINSIRARAHILGDWLDEKQPDVLCIQELKCQEHQFPHETFTERGYHTAILGQKTYNGVAIASKWPLEDVVKGLPLEGDEQARGIAATTNGVRIVNVYVVNGKAVGDPKYHYKLKWMDALVDWVKGDLEGHEDYVLTGDFNLCPKDEDTWDALTWYDAIFCTPEERERFQALLDMGLHDAFREKHPDAWGRYAHTWWDFRGRGFPRGRGLRIDHFLVSDSVMARVEDVTIDRDMRKKEKPSDHAPVRLDLSS